MSKKKTAVHSRDTNGKILKTYYVELSDECKKCGRPIPETAEHYENYGKWCRYCCSKARGI